MSNQKWQHTGASVYLLASTGKYGFQFGEYKEILTNKFYFQVQPQHPHTNSADAEAMAASICDLLNKVALGLDPVTVVWKEGVEPSILEAFPTENSFPVFRITPAGDRYLVALYFSNTTRPDTMWQTATLEEAKADVTRVFTSLSPKSS